MQSVSDQKDSMLQLKDDEINRLRETVTNRESRIESIEAINNELSETVASSGNVEANRKNLDLINYQQRRIDELDNQLDSSNSEFESCDSTLSSRNKRIADQESMILSLTSSLNEMTEQRDDLLIRPSCWSLEDQFPITKELKVGENFATEDGVVHIAFTEMNCWSHSSKAISIYFRGLDRTSTIMELGEEHIVGYADTKYGIVMISYLCDEDDGIVEIELYPVTKETRPSAFE